MARHESTCEASAPPAGIEQASRPTVADVLRRAVEKGHLDTQQLTTARARVLRQICDCRTAAMGGHALVCTDCGATRYCFNSCRNRHCPQCQWGAQEQWIQGRLERLLDTHYFHVVFTLPAELRPLAMLNSGAIYALLFRATSRTLLELGREPKYLGADLGVTAVLHTWTRELDFHPHIHCLVTGGGLLPEKKGWKSARQHYLFPVHVMGALFRGKFLAGLRQLHDRGELVGVEQADFVDLLDRLYRKKWLVYAKRPMAGPEQVIKYLGRYTHRVAISNSRILELSEDSVRFKTRNDHIVTLPIAEFARRFLLHVLPKGFVKIRHYGLFAAANIQTKWTAAHALRPVAVADKPAEGAEPVPESCEACGSTRLLLVPLQRYELLIATETGFCVVDARGPPGPGHSGGLN